jgi:gas vesicle protein
MKNATNIFLGILGAATAGVVIGMLIAPEKGEDLRSNIRGTAADLAKKLGDLINQGKEQFEAMKSIAGDEAEELKNEANGAYKKVKASL